MLEGFVQHQKFSGAFAKKKNFTRARPPPLPNNPISEQKHERNSRRIGASTRNFYGAFAKTTAPAPSFASKPKSEKKNESKT